MGRTAVYPAEFEVVVDGRESSAQVVLSENLVEEAAGIGRKAIFGHELFPLIAVFVGGGGRSRQTASSVENLCVRASTLRRI